MSISIQFSAVTERIQSRNRFLNRTMATSQKKKKVCGGLWFTVFYYNLYQQLRDGRGLKFSEASQPHCMADLEE